MIYLIRHGQTQQNKAGRLQGRGSDLSLNEQGRREAEQAAAFFAERGIVFDACYTSPLRRAVETASIVTGLDASKMIFDDRLLEMDYGPYEGTDMQDPPPEIIWFFRDFVRHPAPPGMEPLSGVVKRLGAFLEALPCDGKENILLSTHAIAMKGALEYLTPKAHGMYWSRYIGNCSVYAFEKQADGFTVPVEYR